MFLIVYVGAIVVLFLFVIMMLNIRLSELWETSSQLVPCVVLLGLCFFSQLLFALQAHFTTFSFTEPGLVTELDGLFTTVMDATSSYQTDPNMRSIGFVLFTEYFYYFIVVGYVLLLSMVGAIVLTLQKTFNGKSQYISKQVLQDFELSLK
jgi:NADH-quinone oxidoreductase subunit J